MIMGNAFEKEDSLLYDHLLRGTRNLEASKSILKQLCDAMKHSSRQCESP